MKRLVSALALIITSIWLPACNDDHQATVILKIHAELTPSERVDAAAGTAQALEPSSLVSLVARAASPAAQAREQASLLSSLSTIRAAVERKRFHYWPYYAGKTANEVAALLKPRITSRVVPQTNLIKLTCVHPDAALVHRIVNGIADTFVEMQTSRSRPSSAQTISDLEGELYEAMRALLDNRHRADGLLDNYGSHQALVLQSVSFRQSLLTFSGKLDELDLQIAAARPLADTVSRAIAPDGPGLASLFDHPDLLRFPDVQELTIDLDAAESELIRLQENFAPGHSQVQETMRRIESTRARLLTHQKAWLLGQKADFEKLNEMRDSVAGMRENVATLFRGITEVMNRYDELMSSRAELSERANRARRKLEETRSRTPEVFRLVEVLEHATPSPQGD